MTRLLLDAYLDRMPELVTGSLLVPTWSPDGKTLGYVDGPADQRQAWRVDLASGTRAPLVDVERLRADVAAATGETPAGRGVPFAGFVFLTESMVSFAVGERVFVLDLDSGHLLPQPAAVALDDLLGLSVKARTTPRDYLRANPLVDPLPMPELGSPDGAFLLSTRDGDLVLRDTADGREQLLTTDGSAEVEWRFDQANPMGVLLGLTPPTTCWSPDSRTVAAYRVDNRGVAQLPQVHYLKRQEEVVHRVHAKAGGVLEKYTLHLVDTYSGAIVDIDLGETRDTYPVHAAWLPDGSGVVVLQMSRDCRRVDVLLADARTGETRPVLSEVGETFVRIHHDVYFGRKLGLTLTPDGSQLVWASERDGWNHLYLYDVAGSPAAGSVRQLTTGTWPVDMVVRIDADDVWFTGRPDPARPYDKHLMRVPLAGGDVVRVTGAPGVHDCFLSPDGRFVVDTWSTPSQAPVHELRDRTGALVLELSRADTTALDALPRVTAREETVLAADGTTELWATVYLPPGFDDTGATTYPVLEYVYGGPQVAAAPHSFFGTPGATLGSLGSAWAQLGYVVVILDARGTPGRSKAFHDAPYPRWATCLADDHAGAIQQLAERLPLDLARVGVFGGSWGAYSTVRLMADRPDVYRAGSAFAPGLDPYSSVLYECYLGLPQDNRAGYDFAQVLTLAPMIQGELLLGGGTSDHATWTDLVKMSEALIRVGKDHEVVVLPEQYHGFDSVHWAYFRTKLAAFFERSLAR